MSRRKVLHHPTTRISLHRSPWTLRSQFQILARARAREAVAVGADGMQASVSKPDQLKHKTIVPGLKLALEEEPDIPECLREESAFRKHRLSSATQYRLVKLQALRSRPDVARQWRQEDRQKGALEFTEALCTSPDITDGEFRVAFQLLTYMPASLDGECYPAVETLARACIAASGRFRVRSEAWRRKAGSGDSREKEKSKLTAMRPYGIVRKKFWRRTEKIDDPKPSFRDGD